MRVLVVGGTGYIGGRLTDHLARQGFRASVLALAPARDPVRGVEYLAGDRNRPEDLRALARRDFDAVIDLIAYHPGQTRLLIEAVTGRTGRFVHLSTVAVYRRLLSASATEGMTARWGGDGPSYAVGKARCEELLEEAHAGSGFPFVILRPAPLMGAGDPASRENYFLKRILAGRSIVHPGPLEGRVILLFIDDLIGALTRALTCPGAVGRAYHLCHADCPTLAEHVREIGRIAGGPPPRIRIVDVETLAAQGYRIYAFPYSLASREGLDVSSAVRDLGFVSTPYRIALERTVQWFLERGSEAMPAWPGRATTQARLCGTHEWLHADLERLAESSRRPEWVETGETILEQFSGWCAGDGRWTLTARWPVPAPPALAPAKGDDGCTGPTRVVAIPDALAEAIPGDDRGADGPAPGSSDLESAWQLAGVLEPVADAVAEPAAWLFAQSPPDRRQDYTHRSRPLKVRLLSFRAALAARLADDERALVTIRDGDDAWCACDWLLERARERHLAIPSLAAFGRVFLAHTCRWLPFPVEETVRVCDGAAAPRGVCACAADTTGRGEDAQVSGCRRPPDFLREPLGRLRQTDPAVGLWACAFDLARLLSRAGLVGGVSLGLSTARSPLFPDPKRPGPRSAGAWRLRPPFLLFEAFSRYFLCHLTGGRLFEVPAPLAALIEAVQAATDQSAAAAILAASLGLPRATADILFQSGMQKLAGLNVLEELHGTIHCIQPEGGEVR
jgi:nucleoside-diphosphate-sugar epimerase